MSTYKTSRGDATMPDLGDLLALPKGEGATERQICVVVQSKVNPQADLQNSLWVVPGKPHAAGGNVAPGQFTAPVMGKLMLFDTNQAMQVPCIESIVPKALQEARYQMGSEFRPPSPVAPDPRASALRITIEKPALKRALDERAALRKAEHVNRALPSAAHVEPVRPSVPKGALDWVTGRSIPKRPQPQPETPVDEPRRLRLR